MAVSSAVETEDLIKARYPLVYIVSSEERRVEEKLRQIALRRERTLAAWSITRGFVKLQGEFRGGDVRDPIKALDHIAGFEGAGIFVLRDFHAYVDNPTVVRKLRDLAHDLKKSQKNVILLSPVLKIPPELEKEIAIIDWDLPDRSEIDGIVGDLLQVLPVGVEPGPAADPQGRERIVEAALGLTYVEAENVLAKSIVRNKTFDIPTILSEKKHIIRKSGILEYYEAQESLDEIGGLETLKAWLQKRRGAFTSQGARLRAAAAQGHPAHRRARLRQVADGQGGRRGVADAAIAPRRRQDLRRARRRLGGEHPQGDQDGRGDRAGGLVARRDGEGLLAAPARRTCRTAAPPRACSARS